MSDDIRAAITESIAGLEGAGDNGDVSSSPDPTPEAPASPPASPPAAAAPVTAAAPAPAPTAPAIPPAPPVVDPTKPVAAPTEEAAPKPGRIPTDRHEKIVASVREQTRAEVRAEHEAAVAKMRAEHEAQLGEHRAMFDLMQIAERDPDRFLDALVQASPAYAARVRPRGETNGNGHVTTGQLQQRHAGPVPEDIPAPNARLQDGTPSYDEAGLRAVLDWNAARTEQRVLAQLKPLMDDHRVQRLTMEAHGKARTMVSQALTWPGFAEHQAEMAAVMRQDPRHTLESAYRAVVVPKLTANRDALRESLRQELLSEIKAKPLAVSSATPSAAPPVSASSDDLQSIIRASIAGIRS